MKADRPAVCPIGKASTNGYRHYRCRCAECLTAHREYRRDLRRRHKLGDVQPYGRFRLPADPIRHLGPPDQTDSAAHRAYYRALRNGYVSDLWADRFAARAGLHVLDLWPDYYELTSGAS